MILETIEGKELFKDYTLSNSGIVMPKIGHKAIRLGENITVISNAERQNFYGTGKRELKVTDGSDWILDTWTTEDGESDLVSINTTTKQSGYSTDDQIVEHAILLKTYLEDHGFDSKQVDNLVWLLQGLISNNLTSALDKTNIS